MLYASTQPERELLSNQYGTVHEARDTYMYDQTTSVELSHGSPRQSGGQFTYDPWP